VHERIVYSFYDFLDALGGVPGLIEALCAMLIGSWTAFNI